jgi:hypothetical protein
MTSAILQPVVAQSINPHDGPSLSRQTLLGQDAAIIQTDPTAAANSQSTDPNRNKPAAKPG